MGIRTFTAIWDSAQLFPKGAFLETFEESDLTRGVLRKSGLVKTENADGGGIIIILLTSTKPRAWKLSKMLNNGCNDFLFGVHCVEEGDRIPPMQSYGQALKQKDCFSGVLDDDCGIIIKWILLKCH